MTATAPALAVDIVTELKSAFADYQIFEKRGLAFGQRLYELRAKSFAQGNHEGKGFLPLLQQAGIPQRTAYYWIHSYEISIGERQPKEEKVKHADVVQAEHITTHDEMPYRTEPSAPNSDETPEHRALWNFVNPAKATATQPLTEDRDEEQLKMFVHRLESITQAAREIADRPQYKGLPSYATAVALCKQLGNVIEKVEPAAKTEVEQGIPGNAIRAEVVDGKISVPKKGWKNAGMVSPTECWTLKISESPKDAVVSTLSDVLETEVDPKYYLSPKCCQGILRRAHKRAAAGKTIHPLYLKILEKGATDIEPAATKVEVEPTIPAGVEYVPDFSHSRRARRFISGV
jgi:hypothetical protein